MPCPGKGKAMKQRSKPGGKAAKAGHPKTATLRRSRTPKSTPKHRSAATNQETENARLTRERDEALEQQWATAEVLNIISASPSELDRVLEVVVKSAARFCEADDVTIFELDGQDIRFAAHWGVLPRLDAGFRFPCTRGSVAGRTIIDRTPIHVIDVQAEAEEFPEGSVLARRLGHRTTAGVPLLRKGVAIGTIQLRRTEVSPFTDKQMALLGTFAAQAVIAIENARLLNELRQRTDDLTDSLEQQTAISEILSVISNSPSDVQPVFASVAEHAARICDAQDVDVVVVENGSLRFGGTFGELRRPPSTERIPLDRSTHMGRVIIDMQPIQIEDLQRAGNDFPLGQKLAMTYGHRTVLGVPLMRKGRALGAILLRRPDVRPFEQKHISLLRTFADQAAIAIENVRLFEAEQQRTRELAKSLDDLRTAQDRLVQTQKLASLGQLTAGIAHEIKNPLNFVNNFSGVSVELIDELQDAVKHGSFDDKTQAEVAELTGTLRDNLDKIVQHGKRADSIVKNMLLHSREGSGERRLVDVNALVEESLNLAYHGARAEKQGFNVSLERSFDPSAGEVDAYPQEITRVLLNLIANGFYAATKRQGQESGNGFEPTISAATKSLGDRVEIRIRDNGIGIPSEVREKMFNPFFTTKPAGEGTGLGLSISHDIIVKQHSGSIEVDTQDGVFTEFRIILPRTAS
jgi:signal transduction histidine kinase